MYCKKCGTEQKPGQKFCPICGTKQYSEEVVGQPKLKKWLWLLLVVLVVGGIGVWYYMSDRLSSGSINLMAEAVDTDSATFDDSQTFDNSSKPMLFSVIPIRCNKTSDEIETTVSFDFPQTGNVKLQDNIVKLIITALTKDYTWGGNPRPSYKGSLKDGKAIAEFFVKEKVKEISEEWERDSIPKGAIPWDESISIKVAYEKTKYVSYEVEFGGAHGGVAGGITYGVTFNKVNGSVVDVIKDPTDSRLKKLLIANLEANYTDGILFKEEYNEHPIPQKSPFLMANGVRFVYQKYEIGPGAAGVIDITLPFSAMEMFMTDEAIAFIYE